MQRKVMVACVGVAAVLIFTRLFGSGARAGWDDGYTYTSRPAITAVPPVGVEALVVARATPAPIASAAGAASAVSDSATIPGAALPDTLGLLAVIGPARAAPAVAAAAVAIIPQAATPTPADPLPTGQASPTPVPALTVQPSAAPTAAEPPPPAPVQATQTEPQVGPAVNGVPVDTLVVLLPRVGDHVREIFGLGQALGRNAHAFSKVGDSTMAWPPLLAAFDDRGAYQLGPYENLAAAIERFAGSFGRSSAAVKKGMHTWSEFDTAWVNSNSCRPGEGPLACELRLNNPSIVFIRLGANDYNAPDTYRENLQKIVEYCLAHGVIPVLGTKPDRLEGPENTINEIVYQAAADYRLPLWDYDRIAATVPGKGLMSDHTHFLDGGSHNYGSPAAFRAADSLEDLTALMMLDALAREIDAG